MSRVKFVFLTTYHFLPLFKCHPAMQKLRRVSLNWQITQEAQL